VKHAHELWLTANAANGRQALRRFEWFDQLAPNALVIAAVLILFRKDREGSPKMLFAQENEPS
jgi:hypothetical protein